MPRRVLFLLALALVGCARSEPTAAEVPNVVIKPPVEADANGGRVPMPREVPYKFPAESLTRGVAYLLKQQSPDGAWRSDVYATFKDGTALTPLAIVALQDALDSGEANPDLPKAIRGGCNFMMKFHKPAGIEPGPDGFDYPIYTASLTVRAFSHTGSREFLPARDAWVKYILDRQLTAKLGWNPTDKQFGGWGYCRVVPKKPEPNAIAPALIESNLSATTFALDALRGAGLTEVDLFKVSDVDVYGIARKFVRSCQNWQNLPPDVNVPGRGQLDGGFHFIYDDPTRNKAGIVDPGTEHPFPSYGSATADGLRALLLSDEPYTDLIVRAAGWLQDKFRGDTHPGKYTKTQEPNRDAVYYYYASSVSRAFREYNASNRPVCREFKMALRDNRDWAAELATALARRQREDGSWVNPIELVRENDPIVATANAVSALSRCRK